MPAPDTTAACTLTDAAQAAQTAPPARRLKLLLYGINFWPELTGIGKYTGEMAAWLAQRGHAVRVLSAPPHYPQWAVQGNYSARRYQREHWQGVDIVRAPLWVPHRGGGLQRIAHQASFAAASLPALLAQWRWRPDVVWVAAPALACAPAALALARLCGARAWLHIQDYEVDAAFELGLLRGAQLRSAALAGECALMRRFDRVSTISQRMLERAEAKGIAPARLRLLLNWADIDTIRPLPRPSVYRAELGIAPDAVVALYSGNMGAKQGLEVLAESARLLRHDPGIQFVLCGTGVGRAALQAQCAGLPHVRFLDLQPADRLSDLLGLADIHLLPQRAGASDLVMPSKLTGMLASGRPVIAGALAQTELGKVAAQCGRIVTPEDPHALANAVAALAADPAQRLQLSLRARAWAEAHFARDSVLRRFESDLLMCVGTGQTAR